MRNPYKVGDMVQIVGRCYYGCHCLDGLQGIVGEVTYKNMNEVHVKFHNKKYPIGVHISNLIFTNTKLEDFI